MNADTLIPLIFGRLTLEALPLHEPILVVTMIVVALGGVALVGALTQRNRAVPLGRSTYTPSRNSM